VCGVETVVANVWGKGGAGALELAEKVIALTEQDNSKFTFTYKDTDSIEDKVIAIATKIYGAKDVEFSPKALISIKQLAQIVGVESFPVVIAKTQYSLSDDPNLLGAPKDFTLHIRDVEVRAGAGFVVALAGAMMLMPGLSKFPSAMKMTINADGVIDGLS
ncbi:MAG: formate--tetrahydrofolate ligase, partial [Clostridia bacterium]